MRWRAREDPLRSRGLRRSLACPCVELRQLEEGVGVSATGGSLEVRRRLGGFPLTETQSPPGDEGRTVGRLARQHLAEKHLGLLRLALRRERLRQGDAGDDLIVASLRDGPPQLSLGFVQPPQCPEHAAVASPRVETGGLELEEARQRAGREVETPGLHGQTGEDFLGEGIAGFLGADLGELGQCRVELRSAGSAERPEPLEHVPPLSRVGKARCLERPRAASGGDIAEAAQAFGLARRETGGLGPVADGGHHLHGATQGAPQPGDLLGLSFSPVLELRGVSAQIEKLTASAFDEL